MLGSTDELNKDVVVFTMLGSTDELNKDVVVFTMLGSTDELNKDGGVYNAWKYSKLCLIILTSKLE